MHPRQIARPVDRRPLSGSQLRAIMRDLSFADAPAFEPTVEALAKAMRDQFPNCTDASLQAEGFTLAYQREYGDAARTLANQGFTRHVEPFDDRSYRIEKAANLAAGLMTPEAIASYLLANGFKAPELGDIITDVTVRAFEIVSAQVGQPEQVS